MDAAGATDDIADLPEEKGPERTCIVTREKRGKDALVRFVLAPDNRVVPDLREKLPGRGAWVLGDAATVALAVKRKTFARAFKKPVDTGPDLPAQVEALLEADALQYLGLAKKAGRVVCGTAKIESAVADQPVIGLVHAKEAGADGRRKLQAAIRRRFGDGADAISLVQIFASDQLDLALGRVHVIHAALIAGAVSEGFIARSKRLDHYRGAMPLSAVGPLGGQSDLLLESGDRDDGIGTI